ncbi:hypothetical protein QTP88_012496 [Uroleucon formosanum]
MFCLKYILLLYLIECNSEFGQGKKNIKPVKLCRSTKLIAYITVYGSIHLRDYEVSRKLFTLPPFWPCIDLICIRTNRRITNNNIWSQELLP